MLTASASAPARDRIRPLMPADLQDKVPDVVLDTRIGRGTVASELDRTVRVRFEGDGLPSERRIIPETTTAQKLLASPAGKPFEALVRRTLATADAARGADDLKTLTLVPDEHAAKAAGVFDRVTSFARATGVPVRFSDAGTPAAERAGARELATRVAAEIPAVVGFSSGWNGGGNLLLTPQTSRNMLATVGAYRPGPGDLLHAAPERYRKLILQDGFDTLVHEAHHSVTPMYRHSSEVSNTFEESLASIFGARLRGRVSAPLARTAAALIKDPAAVDDRAGLGWPPWNSLHLPQPPKALEDTAQERYIDGPSIVRGLLRGAGIDLRTKDGHARAFEILQGREAMHAPRRLADALIQARGIDPTHREDVVRRVRESVSHPAGAKHALDLLDQLAGAG